MDFKNVLFITSALFSTFYIGYQIIQLVEPSKIIDDPPPEKILINNRALTIVYFQDVSGSIKENGVEIISTSVFKPYFDEVDRDIQLEFGIIDNLSAEKLISVILPKRHFSKPILANLKNLNVVEMRKEKERYIKARKLYIEDSTHYYQVRNQKIKDFCKIVNESLAIYFNNLSGQTDLVTAIDVADKVFEYPDFQSSIDFLLLNSDGLDSHKRKVIKMKHKAEVILINAGKNQKTSVDAIITKKMQSSEQAIKFTLNHY